ncbi:ABC transporter ATP-binding protein, partial [Bordetella pertussis]
GLVAVNDITFKVRAGEIMGLIGPNGAGKSTTFNLISGVLPATRGQVRFLGDRIDGRSAREIAKRGVGRTFQHVQLLPTMLVLENVALGAHMRSDVGVLSGALHSERAREAQLLHEAAQQLQRVGLGDYLYEQAGNLALGQQRILEIARALACDPVLLMLDEPSLGLAPRIVREIFHIIARLRETGVAILLVEQNARAALQVADYGYVLETGEIVLHGPARELAGNPRVIESYLGLGKGAQD